MARRSSIKPIREMAEINMTPLIDLTFTLLITFIITMPLVEQGVPVNLPKGKAKELDQSKMRAITIKADGSYFLDQAAVSSEQLEREMNALGARAPDTVIMVRGDEGVPYGKVAEVVRILTAARLEKMGLVTSAEGGGRR